MAAMRILMICPVVLFAAVKCSFTQSFVAAAIQYNIVYLPMLLLLYCHKRRPA